MKKAITLEGVGVALEKVQVSLEGVEVVLKETGEMLSHVVKHMATKEDLTELESRLTDKLTGDINSLERRLSSQIKGLDSRLGAHENHELDKRVQLDVRVGKLEKKIFARK
jgi:archaellum component FlaC